MERDSLAQHLQFAALCLQGAGYGIVECESELLYLASADSHHLRGYTLQALAELVDTDELLRIVINEELGNGGRCLK